VAPLQRLESFLSLVVEAQGSLQKECGQVLGCPYTAVGSEIATQDESLRQLSAEIFARTNRYLASAVADGQRDGSIPAGDPELMARDLHAFVLGVLLQAKINNCLSPLTGFPERALRVLGIRVAARS
jgi:hypothetical protein